MSWWCSSSRAVWSWSWSPYVGVLLVIAGLVAVGIWWSVRGRHQTAAADEQIARLGVSEVPGSSAGRTVSFVLGVITLWICLDWPLAALGAGYLATAQMIRQIVMVMVVAPLLLFACPAALAVRTVGWGRRLSLLRLTARPAFAVPFAAISLVAVNAPALVDKLVPTQYGAFLLDALWVSAGFVLWMPVQCPHPGVRRLTGAGAMTYLIAQSIVPVLPGFWMTWADFPIYSTYELAPRVYEGFDAVTDQQTAAAVLQVGGMVLLWVQIAYRFLSWSYSEMDYGRNRKPVGGAGPAAS